MRVFLQYRIDFVANFAENLNPKGKMVDHLVKMAEIYFKI